MKKLESYHSVLPLQVDNRNSSAAKRARTDGALQFVLRNLINRF